MPGKAIVLIVAAVMAVFAIACSTETRVVPADQPSSGISVSAQGTATGVADVAVLTLGVESQEETVALARDRAAESMDAMLGTLRDAGVADEDIQTTRFSVTPVFDFSDGRQELVGFLVENLATVRIRAIEDTGTLIDNALGAGGDLARIHDLRFTIDDPTALEDEARALAMEAARAKAQTLASAAGVDLGDPISIAESGGAVPIPFDERIAGDLAGAQEGFADTPIELGELDVVINVQVVYELN